MNCSYCDTPLPGASMICVACFKTHSRPCPECLDVKSHLLPRYRKHYHAGPDDRPCKTCGFRHPEASHQLQCPECHGRRYVMGEVASP